MSRAAVASSNARGVEAFAEGRLDEARQAFSEAVAALTPAEDDLAGPVYENLGMAELNTGRSDAAYRAFLRALDGRPESRRQSLELAIVALLRLGRTLDSARLLDIFRSRFGSFPWIDAEGLRAAHEARREREKKYIVA